MAHRHALLIGCPGGNLPGVPHDLSNVGTFLRSDGGGAWYQQEIMHSLREGREQIAKKVNAIPTCDFALVYFTGHGGIQKSSTGERLFLFFENESNATLKEITDVVKLRTSRSLFIIDACRSYVQTEELAGDEYVESVLKSASRDSVKMRELFDATILNCDKGISVIYSCSHNETSMDTPHGGAFTRSLIESARRWSRTQASNYYLPVDQATAAATTYMNQHFITAQNPGMEPEKRNRHYPLALGIR